MLKDYATVLAAALVLAAMLLAGGCDESDAPAVHGVIRVDASPIPPFEVEFRETPSPTPVEF